MVRYRDDDRSLIKRVKKGDKGAFEELVRRHQQEVFATCMWRLGDRHMAEDAAQETFIKAYKGIKGFREEAQFRTFLYRIALNVCSDMWKKRRKEKVLYSANGGGVDESEKRPPLHEGVPDERPAQEKGLIEKERREIIRKCLSKLNSTQRVVLDLIYFKGLKYEEAASILECPVGTVKSNRQRAIESLKECIRRLLGGEDGL